MSREPETLADLIRVVSGALGLIFLGIALLVAPVALSDGLAMIGAIGKTELILGLTIIATALAVPAVVSDRITRSMQVIRVIALLLFVACAALLLGDAARTGVIAWMAVLVLGVGGIHAAALVAAMRGSDFDPGKCERCGYDLRGSDSPRCPECGAERAG